MRAFQRRRSTESEKERRDEREREIGKGMFKGKGLFVNAGAAGIEETPPVHLCRERESLKRS